MDLHENNNEEKGSPAALYAFLGITLAAGIIAAVKIIFY